MGLKPDLRPSPGARKTIGSAPWGARLTLAFIHLGAVLPIAWAQDLGRLLGGALGRFPNPQRAVSELNVKLCFPDLPAAERRALVRNSLRETGRTFFELGALWRRPLAQLEALEEPAIGEELLHAALDSGRGTVLLAPHLGTWEFLNHFLMRRLQLIALYRPPRVAELDAVFLRLRQRTGCVMVPATPAGIRPLLLGLRDGKQVMILPDQEPLRAHGVHVPFFGVPALTMTLVSRLMRRTGSDALYVFAEHRPAGKLRVRFLEAPEGLDDSDEIVAASRLNRGVERCVRLCPEQYLWSYKRFLSAPPGEPTPYRAIWSRRRLRRNPWPPAVKPVRRRE